MSEKASLIAGFLEKGSLFFTFMTQQMCLTFLTLNLIGSNFSRVTDTESLVKIKYTKNFGLFDAFLCSAIPFGVAFISYAFFYRIVNKV